MYDRKKTVHISLSDTLHATITTAFWDPVRDKPIYGAASALITALLEAWAQNPNLIDTSHIRKRI